MSIALVLHCLTQLLTMPSAVELSVIRIVASWGCPISASAVQNSSPRWQLAYKLPNPASAAEPMTF
eukprot:11424566-Ditylum_brightwellii.AAC.1